MTITIPLPDWSAWAAWLQTPVSDSSILYWHVLLAVVAYLVITYVSALIGIIRANFGLNSEEAMFAIVLFPLTGLAAFVLAIVTAIIWLLWWPLSLPLRIYARLSGGKTNE